MHRRPNRKKRFIYTRARAYVYGGGALATRIVVNNRKMADFWGFYTKSESDSAKNPNHMAGDQIKKRKKSKKIQNKKIADFQGIGNAFRGFLRFF